MLAYRATGKLQGTECVLESTKEKAGAVGSDTYIASGRDLQLHERFVLANHVTPYGNASVGEIAS
jgi:hypothetical protein